MVHATKLKKNKRSICLFVCFFFVVKTEQKKKFSQASDRLDIKDKIIGLQRKLSLKSKTGGYILDLSFMLILILLIKVIGLIT